MPRISCGHARTGCRYSSFANTRMRSSSLELPPAIVSAASLSISSGSSARLTSERHLLIVLVERPVADFCARDKVLRIARRSKVSVRVLMFLLPLYCCGLPSFLKLSSSLKVVSLLGSDSRAMRLWAALLSLPRSATTIAATSLPGQSVLCKRSWRSEKSSLIMIALPTNSNHLGGPGDKRGAHFVSVAVTLINSGDASNVSDV